MTKRLVIVLLALGVLFGAIFGFKAFMNAQMSKYFENMQQPPVAVTTTTAEKNGLGAHDSRCWYVAGREWCRCLGRVAGSGREH